MILEELEEIPADFPLGAQARKEWDDDSAIWLRKHSEKIWLVSDNQPVLLIGVFRHTLCSIPMVWILLAEGVSFRHLRRLKKLWPTIWQYYDKLDALCSSEETRKFLEFFGFEPRTGQLMRAHK